MTSRQATNAQQTLSYRRPKPIQFALAIVGMGALAGVALDLAGHGHYLPAWLLDGFLRPFAAPFFETLFGTSRWKTWVQVNAVLGWTIHLVETVYVWVHINGCIRASQGRLTVSAGVVVQYLVGTFLGGVTQILPFRAAVRCVLDDVKRD